jgi:hypothetical protein
VLAVSTDPLALDDDCARADIVIALYPLSRRRPAACAARLIDRRMVWERGAHAVWIGDDSRMQVSDVASFRGDRPWTQSVPP